MAGNTRPGPRLTRERLVIGLVVIAAVGWLVWINVPRTVKADFGLVPAVDKFSYAQWDVDIHLDRDADRRPLLTVTETIVANFPERDQNKGIVRGIPVRWQSSIDNISVTDAAGDDVPVDRDYDFDDDTLYLALGDDEYVHGEQTYVITYRIREGVVADPQRDIQELYWNLLPLNSAQPIEKFSATVRVDASLTDALTGSSACYQGRYGSTDTCQLQQSTRDGATIFSFDSGHRAPGDGVTIAAGFVDDTFARVSSPSATEPPSLFGSLYDNGTVGAITAGIGLAVLLLGRRVHRRYTAAVVAADPRPSTLPPLPQSGVPVTLPPPVAIALLRADRTQQGKQPGEGLAVAGRAEIVHLAVQGALRFEGDPSRGRMSVRLLDRDLGRHEIDQRMLRILFSDETAADTVREIPRKDSGFATAVQSMDRHGRKAAARQGLLRLHSHPVATVLATLGVLLPAAGLVMVLTAPGPGRAVAVFITIAAICVGLGVAFGLWWPEPTLTERGWAARDQLRSVRSHLRRELRRERDRGDTPGAEPVDEAGVEVLQVYERLLPYAMIFKLAGKWSKLLATRYDSTETKAVWMAGSRSAFVGHWQYVNSSVRQSGTYVAPASSSGGGGFSGGSSGGGFSGGGGGGGFSGGR